jgi:protein ImuB
MSSGLYLCACAHEFPAQALLRLRTDWQTEAVVVMEGCAPEEWVCAMNRLAERKGAALGMTRLEAESIAGLRLLKRSLASEAAARTVFLECAARFSPRIEEASNGDVAADARTMLSGRRSQAKKSGPEAPTRTEYALVLDIAGTERLFGPPQQLAERLRNELAEAGFRASIAVSANYDAARMKATAIRGIAVIAAGAEAEALEKLPVAALGIDEERAATLALWGIQTLGELAALPKSDLVARMGPEAQRWHALARGAASHTFVPIEPAFALEEFCEFEAPVEEIDSLLFVGARMIDCLVTRAAGRTLALRSLQAEMRIEGGAIHRVDLKPALPSTDRKFLLKLLQLEIGAHPPHAAVMALTLRAEAGQQSKVQLGLFTPQTPEPSRLDVTLARLRAMVGSGRVGSPVLEDTHRADGFRMEGFAIPGPKIGTWGTHVGCGSDVAVPEASRMALRRVRPARMVRVIFRNAKPAAFRDEDRSYEIAAVYGPWRTSGCWWALNEWDTEEWDVLAVSQDQLSSGAKARSDPAHSSARMKPCPFKASGSHVESNRVNDAAIACLLLHDRTRNTWQLEAFYD